MNDTAKIRMSSGLSVDVVLLCCCSLLTGLLLCKDLILRAVGAIRDAYWNDTVKIRTALAFNFVSSFVMVPSASAAPCQVIIAVQHIGTWSHLQ